MIEFKQLHRHLFPLSPCSQWSFDMCWSSFRIKPTTFRPVLTTIDRRQAITNFSQPTCERIENSSLFANFALHASKTSESNQGLTKLHPPACGRVERSEGRVLGANFSQPTCERIENSSLFTNFALHASENAESNQGFTKTSLSRLREGRAQRGDGPRSKLVPSSKQRSSSCSPSPILMGEGVRG